MMDSPPTWRAMVEAGDGALQRGAVQEAEAYYELALETAEANRDIPAQRLILARLNQVDTRSEGQDARKRAAAAFIAHYPALLKERMKRATRWVRKQLPERTKRE